MSAAAEVAPSREQTHYLLRVMRRKTGDSVSLFNGIDGEWQSVIARAGKNDCLLRVTERIRDQTAEPNVALMFAPVKKNRLDFLVEKATELGVSELYPVLTDRTMPKRLNIDRLMATATLAAEQSERLSIPHLSDLAPFETTLSDWPKTRPLIFMDETGAGADIRTALSEPGFAGDGVPTFVIGPEGGFSASELDVLGNLPFSIAVSLGPRVMRTETAAIAALAGWQIFNGDGCVRRTRGLSQSGRVAGNP